MVLLLVTCALVALLALVGLVWDVWSGLLTSGVDGLLILLVCLLIGGVFAGQALLVARKAGWLPGNLPLPGRKRASAENSPASPAGGRR
jgi:hypothetical protein